MMKVYLRIGLVCLFIPAFASAQNGDLIVSQATSAPCGGTLDADEGTINSPIDSSTGKYPTNQICHWTIPKKTGYRVVLTVDRFQLEQEATETGLCEYDYLDIGRERYCGTALSAGQVLQPDFKHSLVLTFKSDERTENYGFNITYKQELIPICTQLCENGGSCTGIDYCSCVENVFGFGCAYKTLPVSELLVDSHADKAIPYLPDADCVMFGHGNIRTFDSYSFRFEENCEYVLAEFDSHKITVKMHANCTVQPISCVDKITVRTVTEKLEIVYSTENKKLKVSVFGVSGTELQLPYKVGSYMINTIHGRVQLRDDGVFTVNVDLDGESIAISVSSSLQKNVRGLCGNYNGNRNDDTITSGDIKVTDLKLFVESWKVENSCPTISAVKQNAYKTHEIEQICGQMRTSPFSECLTKMSSDFYESSCVTDLKQCNYTANYDCHCPSFTQYARDCTSIEKNAVRPWRENRCKKTCPSNQAFKECAPYCTPNCNSLGNTINCPEKCIDACTCEEGLYLNGDTCVPIDQCPCTRGNKKYSPGQTLTGRCNHCKCISGIFRCTRNVCDGIGAVHGDPHFLTFDGLWYSIAGGCDYNLVRFDELDIIIETSTCGSENNFVCVNALLIKPKSGGTSVKMLRDMSIQLSTNQPSSVFPVVSGNIKIHKISSHYLVAYIPQYNMRIGWNGVGAAVLVLPPSMKGTPSGLLGNYDSLTTNDLKSSSDIIETAAAFGSSWKTDINCVENTVTNTDTCSVDATNAVLMQKCHNMIYNYAPFSSCLQITDPVTAVKQCKEAVCSCTLEDKEDCICNSLSLYAMLCSLDGYIPEWRSADVCNIVCENSKVYYAWDSSCGRTCRGLMENDNCTLFGKSEGCNCPDGKYENKDGLCVTIDQCQCYYQNEWYDVKKIFKEGTKECYCENGQIQCSGLEDTNCTGGRVYKSCPSTCAATCENPNPSCDTSVCRGGCMCPEGLYWDGTLCVNHSQCSCLYQGNSYRNGNTAKQECNLCTCNSGKWKCVPTEECWKTCSVVSGSHFTTFDSRNFYSEGTCEYTLFSDQCLGETTPSLFDIKIKSHTCEHSELTMCNLTVTAKFGNRMYELARGLPVKMTEKRYSELTAEQLDEYTYITSQDAPLGYFHAIQAKFLNRDNELQYKIQIKWDKQTRLYVTVTKNITDYNQQLCGLCGNADDDSTNDFTTSEGAESQDIGAFIHSWNTELSNCPNQPITERDTCAGLAQAKAFAQKQCSVINGNLFKECHSVVDPKSFYDTCVQETCSCDTGGECECFCISIADYADACGQKGIKVYWRSPLLCPTMCEGIFDPNVDNCEVEYSPCKGCVDVCCLECFYGCFEGCYKKCPDGMILEGTNGTCIWKENCICKNEVTVRYTTTTAILPNFTTATTLTETTATTPYVTTTKPVCYCDWTEWMNSDTPTTGVMGGNDDELIPSLRLNYTFCQQPDKIECRPVKTAHSMQPNVTCDVYEGLMCLALDQNPPVCEDYEVRFSCCNCYNFTSPTTTSTVTTTAMETTTECLSFCEYNGTIKNISQEWTVGCTKHKCVRNTFDCAEVSNTRVICPTKPTNLCPSAGCSPVQQFDDCGCLKHSYCGCNASSCRPSPTCERCETADIIPAQNTTGDKCADDTCCLKYESCHKLPCNNEIQCPSYKNKTIIESTKDDCCPQYNCTCLKCDENPTCKDGLIKDEENSNECCTVMKCKPTCNRYGVTYTNNSLVAIEDCYREYCRCSDESCQFVRVNKYTCPELKTCFNDQARHYEYADYDNYDGCCKKRDCKCECIVYGDPHYTSFDGRPYSFQGLCQYVLVETRDSKDLQIITDNKRCLPQYRDVSCVRDLQIIWKGTNVTLGANNLIVFNGEVVDNSLLPIRKNGIHIYVQRRVVFLRINEIMLSLQFMGLIEMQSIRVTVPMTTTFFNSTVGLCGPCTNDRRDDFETKWKNHTEKIDDFAESWRFNRTSLECPVCQPDDPQCWNCSHPKYLSGEYPLPQHCKNNCTQHPCDILNSSVFDKCRAHLSSKNVYKSCVFDAEKLNKCDICNNSAINAYDGLCSSSNICIDWREAYNCTDICSETEVYKSCRSKCDAIKTCKNRNSISPDDECHNLEMNGCFCPHGTVRKAEYSTECVEERCCDCNYPTCVSYETLVLAENANTSDCCPEKLCKCKTVANPICSQSKVLQPTDKGTPGCFRNECVCPQQCPKITPKNCTLIPGCAEEEILDDCNCTTQINCECKSACPTMQCGDQCHELRTYNATRNPDAACYNTCCPLQKCEHVECPIGESISVPDKCFFVEKVNYPDNECCQKEELKCKDCNFRATCKVGYKEIPVNISDSLNATIRNFADCPMADDCCRHSKCICNSCYHEGRMIPLGETVLSSDSCTKFTCSRDRVTEGTYEGCYKMISAPFSCSSPIECSCYENANDTIPLGGSYTSDACCIKRSCENKTCSSSYERNPVCESPASSVPNGYESVEGSLICSNPNCPLYDCICPYCYGDDGETHNIDSVFPGPNPCVNQTCVKGPKLCPTISNITVACETLTCNDRFEYLATLIEKNPSEGVCCPQETCRCKNESDLVDVCQNLILNTTSCADPVNMYLETEENSDNLCCPLKTCTCKNEEDRICNKTETYECPFGYKRKQTQVVDETHCCPDYDCVCNCPSDEPENCTYPTWSPKQSIRSDYPAVCNCTTTSCECNKDRCTNWYSEIECKVYEKKELVKENFYEDCCPKYKCICANKSLCPELDPAGCNMYQDEYEMYARPTDCCPIQKACRCKNDTNELRALCNSTLTQDCSDGYRREYRGINPDNYAMCCRSECVCDSCFTKDNVTYQRGEKWTIKEGNCNVTYICSNVRRSNGCYMIKIDERENETCSYYSIADYEKHVCLQNQYAVSVASTGCCPAFVCETCTSTEPCSYLEVKVPNVTHPRCESDQCVCRNGSKDNIRCLNSNECDPTEYKSLIPTDEIIDNGPFKCCRKYECVCNNSLCPPDTYTKEQLESIKNSSQKVVYATPGEKYKDCCKNYTLVCKPRSDIIGCEAEVTCDDPCYERVIDNTEDYCCITYKCMKKACTTEGRDCNTSTACIPDVDSCGCPKDPPCKCSNTCPLPMVCPVCMRLTSNHSRLVEDAACNNTCCLNHTCIRVPCPTQSPIEEVPEKCFFVHKVNYPDNECCQKEELKCKDCNFRATCMLGYKEIPVNISDSLNATIRNFADCPMADDCCRHSKCVCNSCYHEGRMIPLGETVLSDDSCTKFTCSRDRVTEGTYEGCYKMISAPFSCSSPIECSCHENANDTIPLGGSYTSDACCIKRSCENKTCSSSYERNPVCESPASSVPNGYESVEGSSICLNPNCPLYDCICPYCYGDDGETHNIDSVFPGPNPCVNQTCVKGPKLCPTISNITVACETLTCNDRFEYLATLIEKNPSEGVCCPQETCRCKNESDLVDVCQNLILNTTSCADPVNMYLETEENSDNLCCPLKTCTCKNEEDRICNKTETYECPFGYKRKQTQVVDETHCCPDYDCVCNCPSDEPENCTYPTWSPKQSIRSDYPAVCNCTTTSCECNKDRCTNWYSEIECKVYEKKELVKENFYEDCCPKYKCICANKSLCPELDPAGCNMYQDEYEMYARPTDCCPIQKACRCKNDTNELRALCNSTLTQDCSDGYRREYRGINPDNYAMCCRSECVCDSCFTKDNVTYQRGEKWTIKEGNCNVTYICSNVRRSNGCYMIKIDERENETCSYYSIADYEKHVCLQNQYAVSVALTGCCPAFVCETCTSTEPCSYLEVKVPNVTHPRCESDQCVCRNGSKDNIRCLNSNECDPTEYKSLIPTDEIIDNGPFKCCRKYECVCNNSLCPPDTYTKEQLESIKNSSQKVVYATPGEKYKDCCKNYTLVCKPRSDIIGCEAEVTCDDPCYERVIDNTEDYCCITYKCMKKACTTEGRDCNTSTACIPDVDSCGCPKDPPCKCSNTCPLPMVCPVCMRLTSNYSRLVEDAACNNTCCLNHTCIRVPCPTQSPIEEVPEKCFFVHKVNYPDNECCQKEELKCKDCNFRATCKVGYKEIPVNISDSLNATIRNFADCPMADDCCRHSKCICNSCYHEGRMIPLGETVLSDDSCTKFTCSRDRVTQGTYEGCYKMISTPFSCSSPIECSCHENANDTIPLGGSYTSDACCIKRSCENKTCSSSYERNPVCESPATSVPSGYESVEGSSICLNPNCPLYDCICSYCYGDDGETHNIDSVFPGPNPCVNQTCVKGPKLCPTISNITVACETLTCNDRFEYLATLIEKNPSEGVCCPQETCRCKNESDLVDVCQNLILNTTSCADPVNMYLETKQNSDNICCPLKTCTCKNEEDRICNKTESYECPFGYKREQTQVVDETHCCPDFDCVCNCPSDEPENCTYPTWSPKQSIRSDYPAVCNCTTTSCTCNKDRCTNWYPEIRCNVYEEKEVVKENFYEDCCPKYKCICANKSLCPELDPAGCNMYQDEYEMYARPTDCCPIQKACRCKNDTNELRALCNSTLTQDCSDGYRREYRGINPDNYAMCCRSECVCDSCFTKDNVTKQRGEEWTIKEGNCNVTYICSNVRRSNGCYMIKIDEHENDTCQNIIEAHQCEFGKKVEVLPSDTCCGNLTCVCSDCLDYTTPKPRVCEKLVNQTYEENPLQECCPKLKVVPNDTYSCPAKSCSKPYTAVSTDVTDPATDHCCDLMECRCDVCERFGNTSVNAGDSWTKFIRENCIVTYTCTSNHILQPNNSCLKVEVNDPAEKCPTLSQYEQQHCNSTYQIAYSTGEYDDENPCCLGYECKCKNTTDLCPIAACRETETPHKTSTPIPGTFECCHIYECMCKSDSELNTTCPMWHDYRCSEPGYVRQKVDSDDSCCPNFTCKCDSCVMEETWYPVNKTWTYDNCLVFECALVNGCPAVESRYKYKCNFFNETLCRLNGGAIGYTEESKGCCKTCLQCEACDLSEVRTNLTVMMGELECTSLSEVTTTYCEGICATKPNVNPFTGEWTGQPKWSSCAPSGVRNMTTPVICSDNNVHNHTHEVVTGCSCKYSGEKFF